MEKNIEELIQELNYCTSISDLYQKRLSDYYYGKTNEGKTEFDFVLDEYKTVSSFYFEFKEMSTKDISLQSSFLKFEEYYDYIDSKQRSLEPIYKKLKVENDNQTSSDNKLHWKGTTLQFAELAKALAESKLLSPELTDKQLFHKLADCFNVPHFDKSGKLKEIRSRSKDLTPLINLLERALTNWIKRKD